MAWLDDLEGRLVALDTTPLIYFIEQNPTYGPQVRPFFKALRSRKLTVVTSVVTLLEVVVQPLTLRSPRSTVAPCAAPQDSLLSQSPHR